MAPAKSIPGLSFWLGGNSVHPYVLGWTKAMQPKHPLYLRNDAPLQVVKLRAGK